MILLSLLTNFLSLITALKFPYLPFDYDQAIFLTNSLTAVDFGQGNISNNSQLKKKKNST